jgi:hypothetical protein
MSDSGMQLGGDAAIKDSVSRYYGEVGRGGLGAITHDMPEPPMKQWESWQPLWSTADRAASRTRRRCCVWWAIVQAGGRLSHPFQPSCLLHALYIHTHCRPCRARAT